MGGTNEAKVGLWGVASFAMLQGEAGSGRKRVGLWWQNGAAGHGGFRRRNGRIRSAVGASRRVLRTQSVGSPRLVAPFGAASPGDTRRQKKVLRRQKKLARRQRKGLRSPKVGAAVAERKGCGLGRRTLR